MCSRPPSSPTIVGSAVETIVWSSDASSITSIRPLTTTRMRRCSATPRSARGPRAPQALLGQLDLLLEPVQALAAHGLGGVGAGAIEREALTVIGGLGDQLFEVAGRGH